MTKISQVGGRRRTNNGILRKRHRIVSDGCTKLKTFRSFLPIDKLLNWSIFSFFYQVKWREKLMNIVIRVFSPTKKARKKAKILFSLVFDEFFYDFAAFLSLKASHTFSVREGMTIKMSSRSLYCKRHKMKSSIHWTNIKCLSGCSTRFHFGFSKNKHTRWLTQEKKRGRQEKKWRKTFSMASGERKTYFVVNI